MVSGCIWNCFGFYFSDREVKQKSNPSLPDEENAPLMISFSENLGNSGMKFNWFRNAMGEKAHCMKCIFCLIFLAFLSFSEIRAQYVRDTTLATVPENNIASSDADFSQKLVPGGNFALSLGNPWFLDLSPSLGYQVNERLVSGAGLSYVAYGARVGNVKFRWDRYGGMVFSRYRLFDSFFANAELEMLNVEDEFLLKRVWIVNPLVGASYIMPFGRRGGLQVSLLYNLNYNENLSPFPSPLIWRIGFFL